MTFPEASRRSRRANRRATRASWVSYHSIHCPSPGKSIATATVLLWTSKPT